MPALLADRVRPPRPDHAAELRRRFTDPWRLCEQLGLVEGYKPVRQARGLLIRCPAHGDRTPSCSVTLGPDGTVRVRCFGCDLAGDAFSLIAAARSLDRRHDFTRVLEEAASLVGLSLVPALTSPRPSLRRGPARPASSPRASSLPEPSPAPLAEGRFAEVATALLELSPLAGSVAVGLAARGLLDEAQRDGWGELPVNARLTGPAAVHAKEQGYEAEDLAADRLVAALRAPFASRDLGWIARSSGLVHPEHRLLVPWRSPSGEIWGLQRRYAPVSGDEKPPRKAPKYLWPPESQHAPAERFPYGIDAPERQTAEEVWLCEGAVDVLALRALNRQGRLRPDGKPRSMLVLGLPGVGAWPALRPHVLALVKGRTLVIALDADPAGRALVAPVGEQAWRAGARQVRDKPPPEGSKDWADVTAGLAKESS